MRGPAAEEARAGADAPAPDRARPQGSEVEADKRPVSHRYRDPVAEIWVTAAARIGFRVERTAEAYALTRGDGVIRIGTADLLDADDGLGQMVLHELCHALVEGEDAWQLPDWGLDNTSAKDEVREHACLRLQHALLFPRGLQRILAPTTDYRLFYDVLPDDALGGEAPESVLARIALGRAGRKPFAPHLDEALAATEQVARAAAPFADATSLWSLLAPAPPRHPSGRLLGKGGTCGSCAWRAGARCRVVARRVDETWPACDAHEAALDCQACGACCREAYHSVTVPPRDPVLRRHPELVEKRDGYFEIRREGGRCAALEVTGARYACRIYDGRPRPCREFERASANCLEARRRVGRSR